MAGSRKRSKDVIPAEAERRRVRGRARDAAAFRVAPPRSELPRDYGDILREIKGRIREERLRVVMAANSAMVLLYWDIGRLILDRQDRAGWGARIIDRLSADLREAYPDMKGLSPRNLKYMRAFAAAWPEREIVQEALARIPWYHHLALMEKCRTPEERLWYARRSADEGWSHNILSIQIESRAHERQGMAITNFPDTLPPATSDLAAQVFKDPYLFDFLGTADPRREREVEQASAAPFRRPADHRPALVPREEQARRRVRAPALEATDRRCRMGDEAGREAPEGPEGELADSGGDRGGAGARPAANGEDAKEEVVTHAGAKKRDTANVRGLGYGG